MTYNTDAVKVPGAKMAADYQSSYEFYKSKLKRFSLKLIVDEKIAAKK